MRAFSSTELANKTGDVLAAAAQEPVAIQRHGKSRFVMLSAEEFERLQQKRDTRKAVHVSELSDTDAADLLSALEDSIKDD
ncbi:type II toxin-antitoxin system Phd/YefM family antitoxin [Roseibium marinum]|uniref:Antitoxin n=1 Tax=Roseibium marinum TaxID=281252 RepID=A0A2S3UJ91_9HYPH|nr:type II toxin-antitoxin system prevent-host-death family antitoxin [Roseibium marinum]POF27766.1 prevent-host-death family protein [Roseibium marinum]